MTYPRKLSQVARRAADQAIGRLMQFGAEHPDCLSLAAGFVDESTLPAELVHGAMHELLTGEDRQAVLQYGTTPGMASLRHVFRCYLADLEKNPAVEQLPIDRFILTTGSQQMLSLLTRALFDPGDICLVASPTYFVFLGVLQAVGADVIPVTSDSGGMLPDALDSAFRKLESEGRLDRVRLVYLVSYYDNPSGISIAADRREPLVRIVQHWGTRCPVRLLEDTAYRELRYSGPELPSLWSYDHTGRTVILAHTFSKTFSPGLRVGLSVLPEDLVKPVCDLKGNEDFGSARLNQHILAFILQSGSYRSHVRTVRAGYRIRRDAMLAAAEEYFTDLPGVFWERPDGGLYVWMTLSESIATGFDSRLFRHAATQEKVMYVPGELFCPASWPARPKHQMRLSFGMLPVSRIREGMRRLAAAIQHAADHPK